MLPKAAEIHWYSKPGKRASSLLCEILDSSLHAMEQYLACMFTEALATDREHFLTTLKSVSVPLYMVSVKFQQAFNATLAISTLL